MPRQTSNGNTDLKPKSSSVLSKEGYYGSTKESYNQLYEERLLKTAKKGL